MYLSNLINMYNRKKLKTQYYVKLKYDINSEINYVFSKVHNMQFYMLYLFSLTNYK